MVTPIYPLPIKTASKYKVKRAKKCREKLAPRDGNLQSARAADITALEGN
jgi:hypothetical protein